PLPGLSLGNGLVGHSPVPGPRPEEGLPGPKKDPSVGVGGGDRTPTTLCLLDSLRPQPGAAHRLDLALQGHVHHLLGPIAGHLRSDLKKSTLSRRVERRSVRLSGGPTGANSQLDQTATIPENRGRYGGCDLQFNDKNGALKRDGVTTGGRRNHP